MAITTAKTSAGILIYRRKGETVEVLLAHPGGPFWAHRNEGIWSIPKGEFSAGEETPIEAARREFAEETGTRIEGELVALTPQKMQSGKVVHAFIAEHDLDPALAVSNDFEAEWPPHSGTMARFPEIDRVAWMNVATARVKILPGQQPFITELLQVLEIPE